MRRYRRESFIRRGINKLASIIVTIAITLIGAYLFSQGFFTTGQQSSKESYTPVVMKGEVPDKLFGLHKVSDGKWADANNNIVYEQAREYKGASESQPLKPVIQDNCTYLKDKVVKVKVDSKKYPASALHIYLATRAGVPKVLHVNRNPGYDLRANSLRGIPSNSTFDRDEYPFALSNEAVVYNKDKGRSSIAFIPFSDNRGSGSSMGGQLRTYCTGQAFKILLTK